MDHYGAEHEDTGPLLGAYRDAEYDGQPDPNAMGDDNNGDDDEDGVIFTSALTPGQPATIDVIASAPGRLDAWIDFNDDGSWSDEGDQVFVNRALNAGTNHLHFNVPATATITPQTFSRFRISSAGNLSFHDYAWDGEVEDYAVEISFTPIEISGRKFEDENFNGTDDVVRGAIELVSDIEVGGEALGLEIMGELAYIAVRNRGLYIVDVSDPVAPVVAGSLRTLGAPQDVSVVGDLAYVAASYGDLFVVNVSDPAAPALVGDFETPGVVMDVQVVGHLAYLADDVGGLQIVDISDPAAPLPVGSLDTPGAAQDVHVVGQLAYVADEDGGLRIVDVSDPAAPAAVGNIGVPGASAMHVQVVGNLAYVAHGDAGLVTVDVSDPAAPVMLSRVESPRTTYSVHVVADRAYVADSGMLRIVDVTHPAAPVPMNSYSTWMGPRDVQVVGDLAYVAGRHGGLEILDVSEPAPRDAVVGRFATADGAGRVNVVGDLAYVSQVDGWEIVDVSDPAAPAPVGDYHRWNIGAEVQAAGNFAYALDDYHLRIFDVSDPAAPVLRGALRTATLGGSIDVVGGLVYIATNRGLEIVDVSDPTSPAVIGSFDTPGWGQDVQVVGNLAYVADYDGGFQIIDVSDPTAPTAVGSIDPLGAEYDVHVMGHLAFVSTYYSGFYILDVNDPAVPVLLSRFDMPYVTHDIYAADNLVYVAMGRNVMVLDVSDPEAPSVVANHGLPNNVSGLQVVDNLVYVANGDSGLQILKTEEPGMGGVRIELYRDGGDGQFGSDGAGADAGTGIGGDDDQLVADTVTLEGSGEYSFPGVAAGTYFVREIVPPGYVQTTTPVFHTVTTVSGSDVLGRDFGNAVLGSIHGFSFDDVDGDGSYTPGTDQPLAGVEFTLTGTDGPGNVVDQTTTTDAGGEFVFTGLAPSVAGAAAGTGYTVTETVPEGYESTTAVSFTSDLYSGQHLVAFDGQADPLGTDQMQVFIGAPLMFSTFAEVTISGRKFEDRNGNRTEDALKGMVPIGLFDTSSIVVDMHVVGDLAYIADGYAGLTIANVSDPAAPVFVGGLDTSDLALDVQVVDTLAYVANGRHGLDIIDVSDPAFPAKVGGLDTTGEARELQVVDALVYIATQWGGLQIVDVSDPTAPTLVSRFDTAEDVKSFHVVGQLAYVADHFDGLQILDVSDPAAPMFVGSYDTPHVAVDVRIAGNLAYVADNHSGLVILDVSDPAAPVLVGGIDTPENASFVQVVGDLVYLADGSGGLRVVDVSDPAAPSELSAVMPTRGVGRFQITGSTAYVASSDVGLLILDVSDAVEPMTVGSYDAQDYAYDVQVADQFAYVAASGGGLQIVNVSDPAAPAVAGTVVVPGSAMRLHVVEDVAYIAAHNGGLQIVDVSDPAAPAIVGSFATPDNDAHGIQVVGDLAYVADDNSGLQIVNVSDHTAPAAIGSFDTPGKALNVHVVGELAFVADWSGGLQIVNVSDPAAPVFVGGYDTPDHAAAVQVVGDLAYVADDRSGVHILDVSNPAAPALVGSYDTWGEAYNLSVDGHHLYVADYEHGLLVLDVSDPTAPVPAGNFATQETAWTVQTVGNLAYVADGLGGLQILNVREPGLGDVTIELYRDGGDGKFGSDGAGTGAGTGLAGDDDLLVDSVSTWDKSGNYSFQVQQPGTYFVREILPADSVQTAPASTFHTVPITLAESGRNIPGLDFGNARIDFGDAPEPYAITRDENGAGHAATGPRLGAARDNESDGTHSDLADADGADEDGVTFGPIVLGALDAELTVNVQGSPGRLDAWIDFNADGSWDGPGEQIFASREVAVGDNRLTFDVPRSAHPPAMTFARFRLSTAGGLAPTGVAADGEVEDHQVAIVAPDPVAVTGVVQTPSGFAVDFGGAISAADLNLYDDAAGTLGPPDVTVVGNSIGAVNGSLVTDGGRVIFVATGGPLPVDTYTVTLRAAADGFTDLASGQLIDGDGDGTAGGDFVNTFTVDPVTPVVVSLPDFARGPGQPIDVPPVDLVETPVDDVTPGLPIRVTDADGIQSVTLTVLYDPELLDIVAASPGPHMPVGSTVLADFADVGELREVNLAFSSPAALAAGSVELITLTADVPGSAPAGSTHILDLEILDINSATVAATADDAIHSVGYVGDATGDGTYSGLDAHHMARVGAGFDIGFVAFPLTDPAIVADVTSDGDLGDLDAQAIALKTVGLGGEELPPLPQPMRLYGPPALANAPAPIAKHRPTSLAESACAHIEMSGRDSDAVFQDLTLEMVDLPGFYLGLTQERTLQTDINTAVRGWFIDAAPRDDVGLSHHGDIGKLVATPDSPAHGQADLAAVLHELDNMLRLGTRSWLDALNELLQGDGLGTHAVDQAFGFFDE